MTRNRDRSEILNRIKQMEDVMLGVHAHHERHDGTGYPDRIRNGNVPLIARIISVADTFHAMTANGPYGKSLSSEQAFDALRRCSGTQSDLHVVSALCAAQEKGVLPFEN